MQKKHCTTNGESIPIFSSPGKVIANFTLGCYGVFLILKKEKLLHELRFNIGNTDG